MKRRKIISRAEVFIRRHRTVARIIWGILWLLFLYCNVEYYAPILSAVYLMDIFMAKAVMALLTVILCFVLEVSYKI